MNCGPVLMRTSSMQLMKLSTANKTKQNITNNWNFPNIMHNEADLRILVAELIHA